MVDVVETILGNTSKVHTGIILVSSPGHNMRIFPVRNMGGMTLLMGSVIGYSLTTCPHAQDVQLPMGSGRGRFGMSSPNGQHQNRIYALLVA